MRVLLLVCGLFFCVADASADAALEAIIEDVRDGQLDACRDARWPSWYFDGSSAGRARVEALRSRAGGLAWEISGREEAGALASSRLRALFALLKGLSQAPSRAAWDAGFARAETAFLNWRARGPGHDDRLPGLVARRANWRLAHARVLEQRVDAPVVGGVAACLMARDEIEADIAVVNYLIGALDRGRYPTDALDGPGAASAMLDLPGIGWGYGYVADNWQRLSSGLAPAGVLPVWRVLARVKLPPGTLDEFRARFESEWTSVNAMVAQLPAPRHVGDELFRRTRPEQYGRLSFGVLNEHFAGDPKRFEVQAAMWERINVADIDNTARVKALLSTRGWFDDARDGDGAEHYGWLIVQHADKDPAFQREVLNRMEALLATGRVRKRDYAYLYDRVAVAEQRPQRYGTQYICKNGRYVMQPTERPKELDARRRRIGMEPAPTTLDGC